MTEAGLKREIGLVDATMIVISGIIGGGIFFTPATVAQHLPSGPLILTAWLIGAVVAYAGALTFAELGSRYPEAGGHYIYVRDAFGKLPAFLYGWMLLLIIATGALASLALTFAHYVSAFIPMSDVVQRILGAATIVVLSIINILGVKPGTRTTTVLTAIKVIALGLLIVAGLLVPYHGTAQPLVQCSSYIKGFAAALVPISFTFGGWQQLNFVGGEIKDAQKKIPAALALGVGIVALIYLGANAVYLRALGAGGMAQSTAIAQAAATNLFGDFAARAITILITISILAFSNVVVMVTPRVFYALGQDGVFLRSLGDVHPRFRTPARAIVLQGVWAVLLVLVGTIDFLVNGVVFADWIFFGLGAASLFVIRRRQSDVAVQYRVPGYPWVPAFFVLSAIVAVASAVGSYPKQSLLGFGLLIVGALLFLFVQKKSA